MIVPHGCQFGLELVSRMIVDPKLAARNHQILCEYKRPPANIAWRCKIILKKMTTNVCLLATVTVSRYVQFL